MTSLQEIKNELLGYLEKNSCPAGARLITEYPDTEREFPLRKPCVAIGLGSAKITPGGMGGYLGTDGGAEGLFGSRIRLTLRFDLLVPSEQGGGVCHRLYEELCQALILEEGPVPFEEISCGELIFDSGSRAFRMTAEASFTAGFVKERTLTALGDFQVTLREDTDDKE